MRKLLIFLGFVLAACGYENKYAEGVADYEPIYCYRVLADIQCHPAPDRDADRRLVNYYGPHPSRYDPPEKSPKPELFAPAKIDYWVKDPEPIPEPQAYLPVKSSMAPKLSELAPPLEYPEAEKKTVEAETDTDNLAPAPEAVPAGEVRIELPE